EGTTGTTRKAKGFLRCLGKYLL
ncbi:uncharacterized protein METZ01_LOCUS397502, partial [marine metagenome]